MLTIKQTILNISLLTSIATNLMAQQGTVSSGGVAIGAGGSATYSLGQVNYITVTSAGYRITQGLQQPFLVNDQLIATCSNNNSTLYYGYSGDQTAIVKAISTGGIAPYTVSITMNRPLNCNVISNSGNEIWTGIGGTTINNTCPVSGPGLTPVSTGIVSTSGSYYSVNVTLMQDAIFTATITDANGSIVTCTTSIHAEDARCFAGNSGISKVTICHQTGNPNNPCVKICVDESAVAEHLTHGDFLGKCTPNCIAPIYNTGISSQLTLTESEAKLNDILNVKAWPNPSEHEFTLLVESSSDEKFVITVYDVLGRRVRHIEKGNRQLIRFGEELKAGIYMIVVIQGVNRKTIKLIKQ